MKIDSASVASRLGVSIDRLAETIEVGGARTEKILLSVENKHGTDDYLNWLESIKAAPAPAPEDEVISAIIPTEPAAETVPPRQKPRKAPANDIPKEDEDAEEVPLEPVDSIPCEGAPPVISILGQPKATLAFQGYLNSFHEAGEFSQSILLTGPAGVGKSHTCEEVKAAFDKTGKSINYLEISSAAQLSIITSEESLAFIDALKYSSRGVHSIIFIDEAQELSHCGEAMKRIVTNLIYGSGQGWGRAGSVPFQGKSIPFNSRFLSLVLITNQPKKVMKGNQAAFERRFKCVELERYSPEVMRTLSVKFFKEKGIKVEPTVLTQIVKLHRGTLEALSNFLEMASGHHSGTITMEVFNKILPLCKFTLRGFKHEEVTALRWLAQTTEPRTKANLIQNFPQLDIGEFYRHAIGQEKKVKNEDRCAATPFVKMTANQYEVTEHATKWLEIAPK